jgi:sec-independent protein translocase protein TatA
MGSMSAAHWLIVLFIVLLVFGPKRLASLGKGMGEGIRSFREGLAGEGGDHDHPEERRAIDKEKPREPRDQTQTPS